MAAGSGFGGFSGQSFDFMRELGEHNHTAWFAANRERWEAVKAELKSLCLALGPFLAELDPELECDPRSGRSLGRINRDTRFSPDKHPYRDWIDLLFFPRDHRRTGAPGFAVGIQPEQVYLGSWLGASMPEWRKRLTANIAAWPEVFERYLEAEGNFRDCRIESESYLRPRAKGLPPLSDQWARRRYYYLVRQLPAAEAVALGPAIIPLIEETILRLYPLYLFATSERPAAELERFRRRLRA